MRETQIVTLELAAVADELSSSAAGSRQVDRLRGALAALEWAVGNKSEAPVSGRLLERPATDAVISEQEWATEIVTGIRSITEQVTHAYAGGVEEALFWLNGADCAPVGTDEIYDLTRPPAALLSIEAFTSLHEAMTMEQASPPDHYDANDLTVLAGILGALDWLIGNRNDCPMFSVSGPTLPKLWQQPTRRSKPRR